MRASDKSIRVGTVAVCALEVEEDEGFGSHRLHMALKYQLKRHLFEGFAGLIDRPQLQFFPSKFGIATGTDVSVGELEFPSTVRRLLVSR